MVFPELDILRALVTTATPGPWKKNGVGIDHGVGGSGHSVAICTPSWADQNKAGRNAAYISAADPLMVSRLLDVVDGASSMVLALKSLGFGSSSDRALPGEYDTLVDALAALSIVEKDADV